jgi:hypothetical protein
MCDCCGTWPEQNAVDAWLKKHGIEVEHKVRLELKEVVTECRLRIQKERDGLRARLQAAETQVGMLREALDIAKEWCPECQGYGHIEEVPCEICEKVRDAYLPAPPPARWEAMRRVVEAARELHEVAELRGDNCLPAPPDDPKLWTARMQMAWNELDEALAALEGGENHE